MEIYHIALNVTQYSLLLIMMAQIAGFEAGELVHVIADAHIYDRHVPMVEEMIKKEPKPAPKLIVDRSIDDFYRFTKAHFQLEGYAYHDFNEKIPVAI